MEGKTAIWETSVDWRSGLIKVPRSAKSFLLGRKIPCSSRGCSPTHMKVVLQEKIWVVAKKGNSSLDIMSKNAACSLQEKIVPL